MQGSATNHVRATLPQSCYGHTEGTAGLTGALLAAGALQLRLLPPVVNLREVNPYVSAALGDWRSRQGVAGAAPRQLAAAALLTQEPLLAGTSSFGMSGVNAHALLAAAGAAEPAVSAAAPQSSLAWERSTHWPHPLPHPLLLLVTVQPSSGGSGNAECACDLGAANLAWLRDHQVQGRALLPGAAMFEVAAAAAAACLGGNATAGSNGSGSRGRAAALSALSILAPCLLPGAASARSSALLCCSVATGSGAVEVHSSSGVRHLRAVAGVVPAKPAAGPASQNPLVSGALLPARAAAAQPTPLGHNMAAVAARLEHASGCACCSCLPCGSWAVEQRLLSLCCSHSTAAPLPSPLLQVHAAPRRV